MAAQRSPEETQRAFDALYKAIQASCKAYDAGETWEAMRIATAVHTLVHDHGKNYISVLSRLGIRSSLRFLSSGRVSGDGQLAWSPLVGTQMSDTGTRYFPMLGNGPQGTRDGTWDHESIQFGRWWEKEIISRGIDHTFTRKGLVFALRNKEGGGHYGDIDDPRYAELLDDKRLHPNPAGIQMAMMRQIGWEITMTFERRASAI
jgi:hypothetical protein